MKATPTAAASLRSVFPLATTQPACCGLLFALLLGTAPLFAQGQTQDQAKPKDQDVQQLQEQIRQLEQTTQELKARIANMERTRASEAEAATPPSTSSLSTPASNGSSGNEGELVPISLSTTTTSVQSYPPGKNVEPKEPGLDIYGYAMLDLGYNFGQIDPNWFDTMRPTKLPSFPNQFGRDGVLFSGVRQSRFGVKGYIPTPVGEVKTIFEYELFGVGVDTGQTTFRLRHAWGELGQIGAGQTWSTFMDPDVFPNSLEYWGPNGMVFFRNVQLRWMPVNKGNHQLYIAFERPGASADPGSLAGRNELAGIQARFPAPDVSAHVRWGGERDYLQIAGIGRYIAWDDLHRSATLDLGGHIWGWGVNVSSNLPGWGKKDLVKLEATYGHGIENYMNDAPVDVAPIVNRGNLRTPVTGAPLPVLAMLAFYDRYWSERWSTSLGYSYLRIDNVPLQVASEFHKGQYGLVNLLFYPAKNVLMGGEFQWGRRDNFRDGFSFDDYKLQFSFKYSFDYKLGSAKKLVTPSHEPPE